MAESITIEKIYSKVSRLETRLNELEQRLVPEVKISKKEQEELEKIRQEIRNGNFATEKELFSTLVE